MELLTTIVFVAAAVGLVAAAIGLLAGSVSGFLVAFFFLIWIAEGAVLGFYAARGLGAATGTGVGIGAGVGLIVAIAVTIGVLTGKVKP